MDSTEWDMTLQSLRTRVATLPEHPSEMIQDRLGQIHELLDECIQLEDGGGVLVDGKMVYLSDDGLVDEYVASGEQYDASLYAYRG